MNQLALTEMTARGERSKRRAGAAALLEALTNGRWRHKIHLHFNVAGFVKSGDGKTNQLLL